MDVTAGGRALLRPWTVDLVVVFCVGAGFAAAAVAEVSDDVAALTMLGLLGGVPMLYGIDFAAVEPKMARRRHRRSSDTCAVVAGMIRAKYGQRRASGDN